MVDEVALRRGWVPSDEAALKSAFNEGYLEEKNWCELKAKIPSGKPANTELARDLASLTVDGGTMIVGIDEKVPDGNAFAPVELHGLRERIEAVATFRAHPPIQVDSTVVPSAEDPAIGYVVVHVPASPLAPHQVDGAYYGRGDTGKRKLSDAEVERLFQRRSSWARSALGDLDGFIERTQVQGRMEPELYVVARPVAAWPEMLRPVVGAPSWHRNLETLQRDVVQSDLLRQATSDVKGAASVLGIQFSNFLSPSKTATGAALVSDLIMDTHGMQWTLTLDIGESGLVGLAVGAIAVQVRHNNDPYLMVLADDVAGSVLEFLETLSNLSGQVGYTSEWDIALSMTKLQDSRSGSVRDHRNTMGTGSIGPGYDRPDYQSSTRTTMLELARQPGAVVDRLLGLYGRSTGTTTALQPLFDAKGPDA